MMIMETYDIKYINTYIQNVKYSISEEWVKGSKLRDSLDRK